MVFLPRDKQNRKKCELALEDLIEKEGLVVLGWRDLPTDNAICRWNDVGIPEMCKMEWSADNSFG